MEKLNLYFMQVDLMILPSCGAPQKNTLTFPFFSLEILSKIWRRRRRNIASRFWKTVHIYFRNTQTIHILYIYSLISAIRLVFIIIAYMNMINVQCSKVTIKHCIHLLAQNFFNNTCNSQVWYFSQSYASVMFLPLTLEINGIIKAFTLSTNYSNIYKTWSHFNFFLNFYSIIQEFTVTVPGSS